MNQKENAAELSFRQCAMIFMHLANGLHRPLRLFASEFRSVGWRAAGDLKDTLAGLVMIFVWAALSNSNVLLVFGGGLAILCEIVHRLFPGREHSRAFGWCALAKLTKGNNLLAYRLMGVLAILVGGAVWQMADKGSGSYLVAAGFSLIFVVQYLHTREVHMRQDEEDAMHYAETHGR